MILKKFNLMKSNSVMYNLLKKFFFIPVFISPGMGCNQKNSTNLSTNKNKLIILDPGHFHAALLQKQMYATIDSNVYVYAPETSDADVYFNLVKQYNTRQLNPTRWNLHLYRGNDYFEKLLEQKNGNLVIVSGNNSRKIEYLKNLIQAGFNVFADKPLVIKPEDYDTLEKIVDEAKTKGIVLNDIMTSRYDPINIIEKVLMQNKDLFGELMEGTREQPSVEKESVHYFSKIVSGKYLNRPAWFFDTNQQGEGIIDVSTHLLDLAYWECFPSNFLKDRSQIKMLSARRWPTRIDFTEFSHMTKTDTIPRFLKKDVKGNSLVVYANGAFQVEARGINIKITVRWDVKDTGKPEALFKSVLHGTKATISIVNMNNLSSGPVLSITPESKFDSTDFEKQLNLTLSKLSETYKGISAVNNNGSWVINIPPAFQINEEEQFALAVNDFLNSVRRHELSSADEALLLGKYYTLSLALKTALKDHK